MTFPVEEAAHQVLRGLHEALRVHQLVDGRDLEGEQALAPDRGPGPTAGSARDARGTRALGREIG